MKVILTTIKPWLLLVTMLVLLPSCYEITAQTSQGLSWGPNPTAQRDIPSPSDEAQETITLAAPNVLPKETAAVPEAGAKWQAQVLGEPETPAIADGVVYVATQEYGLNALDAANGSVKWRLDLPNLGTSPPIVADGLVYVGIEGDLRFEPDLLTTGYLVAVNARAGTEIWRFKADGEQVTKPALFADAIYFGTGQSWGKTGGSRDNPHGYLYAVNAKTGALQWSQSIADGDIWEAPVVSDGVIYFVDKTDGTRGAYLYAIDTQCRQEIWKFYLGGSIYGNTHPRSPVVSGDTVYVENGNNLYAVDARSGRLKWVNSSYPAYSSQPLASGYRMGGLYQISARSFFTSTATAVPGGLRTPPTAVGETVFIRAGIDSGVPAKGRAGNLIDEYLIALEAATGHERWRKHSDEGRTDLLVADEILYMGDYGGVITAILVGTGQTIWKFEAKDTIEVPPAVADGIVYVVDYGGNLYAVDGP